MVHWPAESSCDVGSFVYGEYTLEGLSSLRPPSLLGSTVEEDYGAAELERDRPNGPIGVPILRVRSNGHLYPLGTYREQGCLQQGGSQTKWVRGGRALERIA